MAAAATSATVAAASDTIVEGMKARVDTAAAAMELLTAAAGTGLRKGVGGFTGGHAAAMPFSDAAVLVVVQIALVSAVAVVATGWVLSLVLGHSLPAQPSAPPTTMVTAAIYFWVAAALLGPVSYW
jgi:hypothetical protein